ncbi:hypothetical protein MMC30_005872 [Trapelia coarctata]|nr:hypothetical protein [Trapelia coarctata]
MFPPYRPTHVAFIDGPTRRPKFRKHGPLQEGMRELPDQLSSQMNSSDPSLGSKRRHDEAPSELPTKRSKYQLLGSSQRELDLYALVQEGNQNVDAYSSPPVSPKKSDCIQEVATKVNTTSNLTKHSKFGTSSASSLEHHPRLGSSSSQNLTTQDPTGDRTSNGTDGPSLADTLHLDTSPGVFSFTAGSQLPQQAEEVTSLTVVKAPRNSLPVEDRKRFFLETPTYSLKVKLEKWVSAVYKELGLPRSDDECWLHPCPPSPKPNGRAYGTIARRFSWRDGKSHNLTVNFGIVALTMQGHLVEDQKEGFITKSWHLSHLCGNWTCCNSRHHTVEPRSTNIKRNACFRKDHGCEHQPPCMKHLKRRDLLPMRELVSDKVSV